MDLQKLFDMMGNVARDARKEYHLTLGDLIDQLVILEAGGCSDAPVKIGDYFVSNPHSYRGYYSDLALEATDDPITVSALLKQLKEQVLDKTLEGYKGGDFLMGGDTPLWISSYGCADSIAVVGSDYNGDAFYLETKRLES